MGRLIVSSQVTVDGVMDQLEGWFDAEDESAQHGLEQLRAADAVVLGRETYEFLSEYWPTAEGPYADLINPLPKYVASRTLSSSSTAAVSSRTTSHVAASWTRSDSGCIPSSGATGSGRFTPASCRSGCD